jgi:hypothetical protein
MYFDVNCVLNAKVMLCAQIAEIIITCMYAWFVVFKTLILISADYKPPGVRGNVIS